MSALSVSRKEHKAATFSKILAVSFLAGGFCICGCRADDKPAANSGTPAGSAANPADAGDSVSQAVEGVFNHSHDAVVKIEGVDSHDQSVLAGTGFFIDPNGLIYTSYSVGGDTDAIVVSFGEKKYPAKRLLGDPRSGIAILKIDARTPFLPICKSNDLAVATPVLTIGYPMNLPLTPSLGIVAGIDARDNEGYFLTRHIRANVAVERGEGGSPMLNLKGEVVGIVISAGGNDSSCCALPMEAAEKVRSDYVRFGDIHHGVIGIHVVPAPKAMGGSKVIVDDLFDNTPAAKSGLQKGDYV